MRIFMLRSYCKCIKHVKHIAFKCSTEKNTKLTIPLLSRRMIHTSYTKRHARINGIIGEWNRLDISIGNKSSMLQFVRKFANASDPPPELGKQGSGAKRNKVFQKENLWTAVGVIAGIHVIIYVYIKYERRRHRGHQQKEEDFEIYLDPYMSKDAKMINYKGTWIPYQLYAANAYEGELKAIMNFPVYDDDIFVASFPKSGTTWLQQIVHLVVDGEKPSTTMEERFPYLEYIYPGIKELSKQKGPRHIKTHLPYSLLPKNLQEGKGKVLYIARNPKDVCVSFYFFSRMLSFCNYKGSLPDMFESFLEGRVSYGPWWHHVLGYWKHKDSQNILFVTYEDLHKEPDASIQRIAEFLGYSLSSDGIRNIAEKCCFEKMQEDPNSNYSWWDDLGLRNKKESLFMRKGRVGDWTNYFTDEMSNSMDQKMKKELASSKLNFIDMDQ